MTATRAEARDAMIRRFIEVWTADPVSQDILVALPDKEFTPPTSTKTPYGRVIITHNPGVGGESGLTGGTGTRRYLRTGVILVELFTPKGDGLALADQLVAIVARCFEGVDLVPSGVWFRGVRHTEVESDGAWAQTNVLATFEYDEVR